ncbi:MAG: hypothetical protein ACRDFW_08965 [bacterium]
MSGEAHIIDIDSIVLTGVNKRHHRSLTALIEAEVQRALSGAGLSSTGIGDSQTRVVGEVARSVAQSVEGGSNGI